MENSEIITAIRSGDKEVIKEVYKDNAKDVYNFAKSITGDHDSAMNATKRTFVTLFNNIQKGEEPTNIRLAALKLAYDEACRIAMPSTENIDSPFDQNKNTEEEEQKEEAEASEVPVTDSDVEEAEDTEEYEEAPEENEEAEYVSESADKGRIVKVDFDDEPAPENKKEFDISNTQVFSIKEAMENEEDIEMDEEDEEYDDEYDEEDDDDYYDEDTPSRGKAATVIIVIINILLVIILLWLLYGLLVSFGVISDLIHLQVTYDFFNNHIYPIF